MVRCVLHHVGFFLSTDQSMPILCRTTYCTVPSPLCTHYLNVRHWADIWNTPTGSLCWQHKLFRMSDQHVGTIQQKLNAYPSLLYLPFLLLLTILPCVSSVCLLPLLFLGAYAKLKEMVILYLTLACFISLSYCFSPYFLLHLLCLFSYSSTWVQRAIFERTVHHIFSRQNVGQGAILL